jgi:hypothetical protein
MTANPIIQLTEAAVSAEELAALFGKISCLL